ncbi:MAG: hypothetical protein IKC63_02375 [Clostridia bacterium]|nr:hypothetical protein [Clostridia bacterium]
MKRLFSIQHKPNGIMRAEVEHEVYAIFTSARTWQYFDRNGASLPDYRPPKRDSNALPFKPYQAPLHEDAPVYNRYGVACGNESLIDREGNEIPDTRLNLEDSCSEYDRYFVFGMLSDEQCDAISRTGVADGITVHIYDTKTRRYVARDLPENTLDVSFFDGEPEVVLAAITLLKNYDSVDVSCTGTIIAEKNGIFTVYDYYEEA